MDPKELRKFAAECLQLAMSAATPEERASLRAMAREMLAASQQQQIQPDKDSSGNR